MLNRSLPITSAQVRANTARWGRSRAIVATSLGNMMEWYDFAVYAQFAGYIAGNYCHGGDANVSNGAVTVFGGGAPALVAIPFLGRPRP